MCTSAGFVGNSAAPGGRSKRWWAWDTGSWIKAVATEATASSASSVVSVRDFPAPRSQFPHLALERRHRALDAVPVTVMIETPQLAILFQLDLPPRRANRRDGIASSMLGLPQVPIEHKTVDHVPLSAVWL